MNKKQLSIERARKALEKEMDIIELLKSRRFYHYAFEKLLTPEQYQEMKERSEYEILEPDETFTESVEDSEVKNDVDKHITSEPNDPSPHS